MAECCEMMMKDEVCHEIDRIMKSNTSKGIENDKRRSIMLMMRLDSRAIQRYDNMIDCYVE